MIERLVETAQAAGGTTGIDERIRDRFFENLGPDVMRARKGREQSVRRKQHESADVQFLVAAERALQTAFGFRERGRVEDDEIEALLRFLGAAKKLKDVLLDPADRELIAGRVRLSRANQSRRLEFAL